MNFSFNSKRALLALLFFTITGCHSKQCREWGFQATITKCPYYNAGRLLLEPEREYDYLEIEILRTHSGIRFYLNILFLQAAPSQLDPTRAMVEVYFENSEEPWIIYPLILKGGQRLLLDNEDSDLLINALLQGQSFEIKIRGNSLKVISESFCKKYEELMKIEIEEILDCRQINSLV